MAVQTVTIAVGSVLQPCEETDMASDKKPKRGVGRPQSDEPTVSVSARIPESLEEILDNLVRKTRPKTTMSAVIADAIELYLRERGLLGSSPQEEGQ